MTDTDWKEEAGMGAEPPVPESPVIPPVAEGTEPGAGISIPAASRRSFSARTVSCSSDGRKYRRANGSAASLMPAAYAFPYQ